MHLRVWFERHDVSIYCTIYAAYLFSSEILLLFGEMWRAVGDETERKST